MHCATGTGEGGGGAAQQQQQANNAKKDGGKASELRRRIADAVRKKADDDVATIFNAIREGDVEQVGRVATTVRRWVAKCRALQA